MGSVSASGTGSSLLGGEEGSPLNHLTPLSVPQDFEFGPMVDQYAYKLTFHLSVTLCTEWNHLFFTTSPGKQAGLIL